MQVKDLNGPLLFTPKIFKDKRGFFFESWNQNIFLAALEKYGQKTINFVQDNHSRSNAGVLRGLHYQLPPYSQGKLVRCIVGEIFDVAVDIRKSSSSFGKWQAAILSATNYQQLWVPPGFAHGFLTLSDYAEVLYKTTDFWDQGSERSIRWDDQEIAINWPLEILINSKLQLSEKDKIAPLLAEIREIDLFQ
jgi:dTDP-4-dehydrorhamnose 3,5-epimerase